MNHIKLFSLLSFSIFILSGCEDSAPQLQEYKPVKQKTLSARTEIKASATETVRISIPTVVCKTCENNIQNALNKLNGIVDSKIDIENKTAEISFDPALTTAAIIRQVISDAGYDADDVRRNKNAYQKLDECCKIESNIHS